MVLALRSRPQYFQKVNWVIIKMNKTIDNIIRCLIKSDILNSSDIIKMTIYFLKINCGHNPKTSATVALLIF